jgi:TPR repeat protein
VPAPNDSSARILFRQACNDHQEADGCFQLALAYENGRGATQDFGRAASYYRRACDRGLGEACYSLALLYEKGAGVPRIPEQATRLKSQACQKGYAPACSRPTSS